MTQPVTIDPATSSMLAVDPVSPSNAPRQLFALKHGDTFLIADHCGDIVGGADGMFRDDTRVLSRFCLTLGGHPVSLLGSAVSQDNVFFTANVTNHPLPPLGEQSMPQGVIHIERTRFLWRERLYERITLVNYGERRTRVPISLDFAADFRDMFEVRGQTRSARGRLLAPEVIDDTVVLRYEGLDGVARSSIISFSETPSRLTAVKAEFAAVLPERTSVEFYIEVGPERAEKPSRKRFRAAAARARVGMRGTRRLGASLRSSGRLFNDWLEKSRADLSLLTTELPTGPYPYAGIPWFSTAFGRDAIVTALQTLWLNPALARGVLMFLSTHQAQEVSRFQDAAPGKIMHETRKGEMNVLRELPFGRYYGGVDTTPLFVMLAGAYAERTADMAFVDELWPSLNAAMAWIEGAGDSNRDGLLNYERGEETGLANQGWKDSFDSIFHADGSSPRGPIALIEVQGYVFAACKAMSTLAARRGEAEMSAHWRARAETVRAKVEEKFWMEDLGFYALALDGDDRLCRVRASNVGHLLYVGLPAPERAASVMEQLLAPAFSSGWGVRTLAQSEARFNPMSYHNGSVWPHDTSLCAAGFARYGGKKAAVHLLSETFEAAVHFGMRLPELFCGFRREAGEPPIAYPVACLPQAWSSGAVFMMLEACLGLRIDGEKREIYIDRPELPSGIDRITLHDLPVGDARVDLAFQRVGKRVVTFPEKRDPGTVRVLSRV
jgi:glycogen debranching enzyme